MLEALLCLDELVEQPERLLPVEGVPPAGRHYGDRPTEVLDRPSDEGSLGASLG
jgi:hypothetical protein